MTFNKCNPERSVSVLAKYKDLKAKHEKGTWTDQELFDWAYRLVWNSDMFDTVLWKQRMGLPLGQ